MAVANGKSTSQACKEAEINPQTYYRWRKEYGGLKVEQAKWIKELEKENTRLRRQQYDTVRSHAALGYRPPAPEDYSPALLPKPISQTQAVM